MDNDDDFVNVTKEEAHEIKCVYLITLAEKKLGHPIDSVCDFGLIKKKRSATSIILQVIAVAKIVASAYGFVAYFT